MLDIEIDDRGDILLLESRVFPKLRIDFSLNRYPVFEISFTSGFSSVKRHPSNALKIMFHTEKNAMQGNIKCKSLTENYEIRQRTAVRLRTELGDINNRKTLGSLLYAYKHKDITDYDVRNAVKETVEDAVKEILEEPEVVVRKENSTGNFFCENLNVYIYEKGSLVYNFGFPGDF